LAYPNRFRLPSVYPILDTASLAARRADPVAAAEALLQGGAAILQYRHKEFWSRNRVDEARRIAELCRTAGALFIVNDRADYAAAFRHQGLPAGLHVGQEDLTPADARTVIGPEAVLGFSTHNAPHLEEAARQPADYLAFGPVFPTATKRNPSPVTGVEVLRSLRPLTHRPLVAIGGITLVNALSCFRAGADSVAVISALLPDPFSPQALERNMREWQRLATL
jgi:thiamine-phosphate pyrophosphorylase